MSELSIDDFEPETFILQLHSRKLTKIGNADVWGSYKAYFTVDDYPSRSSLLSNVRMVDIKTDFNSYHEYPNEIAWFTGKIREAIGNGGKGIFYTQEESEIGKDERMTLHTFKIAKIHYSSDLSVYSNGAKHSFGHIKMPDGKGSEDAPEWVKSVFRNTKNFRYIDEQTIIKNLDQSLVIKGLSKLRDPIDPVKSVKEAEQPARHGLMSVKEYCKANCINWDEVMKKADFVKSKLDELDKAKKLSISQPISWESSLPSSLDRYSEFLKTSAISLENALFISDLAKAETARLKELIRKREERKELERLKTAAERSASEARTSRERARRAEAQSCAMYDRYFQKLLEVHAETLKNLPTKEDKAFGLA